MKKFMCVTLAMFLVFIVQFSVSAAPIKQVPYTPASVNIMYNDEQLQLKRKPVQYKEFILVPAHDFYESLGATVTWDAEAEMTAVTTATDSILFFKNQKSVIVNGVQYPLVTPAVVVNGTFMVEITSAAAALNYGVYTDGNTIYMEPLEMEEAIMDDGDVYDQETQTEEEREQERIERAYKSGII